MWTSCGLRSGGQRLSQSSCLPGFRSRGVTPGQDWMGAAWRDGDRARAFPSSSCPLPLAGASAGSTSPGEPAVRGKPTSGGGPAHESSPGFALLLPTPGPKGQPPGEGSAFLCTFSRKHLAVVSSLGRLVTIFSSAPLLEEFTTFFSLLGKGVGAGLKICSGFRGRGLGGLFTAVVLWRDGGACCAYQVGLPGSVVRVG